MGGLGVDWMGDTGALDEVCPAPSVNVFLGAHRCEHTAQSPRPRTGPSQAATPTVLRGEDCVQRRRSSWAVPQALTAVGLGLFSVTLPDVCLGSHSDPGVEKLTCDMCQSPWQKCAHCGQFQAVTSQLQIPGNVRSSGAALGQLRPCITPRASVCDAGPARSHVQ